MTGEEFFIYEKTPLFCLFDKIQTLVSSDTIKDYDQIRGRYCRGAQ